MKTIKPIITALIAMAVLACSKDDSPTPDSENPTNKAPNAFNLIGVTNNATGVNLLPSFSWNAAIDPDGDAIKYDLYLDDNADPTTLYAENLFSPNFTVSERLHLINKYHWKVVAKDSKGAQVSSMVNTFTTRNLRFPNNPITNNPGFSARSGFSLLVFQNKLWILGGYDVTAGEYKNDVWNSEDGISWTKVSPNVPIKGKPQFPVRTNHSSVVFNNKIWVIGGVANSSRKNDVWYSEDGISWIEATPEAPFESRAEFSTEVFNNKLWVIRGNQQADVWFSNDGLIWTETSSEAGFPDREYHSSMVFHDKLWLIGGEGSVDDKIKIWNSADGATWQDAGQGNTF